MYVEMSCNCDSAFSIDSDGEHNDHLWALIWRFGNAHIRCGFITSGEAAETENETFNKSTVKAKRVTKPKEDEV
jgi:hypothetical protein